jgi:hypothetical protein
MAPSGYGKQASVRLKIIGQTIHEATIQLVNIKIL